MKIVIYDPMGFDEEYVARVQQTAPDAQVVNCTEEQLPQEIADAEVFFGFHSPEVFQNAAKLKWIQTMSAGMEIFMVPELTERGLVICNASGIHAHPVTETAWALTAAVARGFATYFRHQHDHRWEFGPQYDLDEGTAGIIGMGGIGRRYARIAVAFGMRVVSVDLHLTEKPENVDELWPMDRLDELLKVSDVVLVACPFSSETYNLLDADQLSLMKPTAILVNIARGGIVNEEALSDALRNNRLAGAGLDVTETEPLPTDSPLWDVPNLIISPHGAGRSNHRMRRLTDLYCENLRRYLAGEPLKNVIDQQKGYPVPTN